MCVFGLIEFHWLLVMKKEYKEWDLCLNTIVVVISPVQEATGRNVQCQLYRCDSGLRECHPVDHRGEGVFVEQTHLGVKHWIIGSNYLGQPYLQGRRTPSLQKNSRIQL